MEIRTQNKETELSYKNIKSKIKTEEQKKRKNYLDEKI